MIIHFYVQTTLLALTLGACSCVVGQSSSRQIDPAVTRLGSGFVSDQATVNGTKRHFVRGGTGPAIILMHGFPQDWHDWHAIMPLLAKRFSVIAVDLRGVGGSTATPGGYDAANMAEDVYQLASAPKLEHLYIVGHDIGGMVTYAFVRRYPQSNARRYDPRCADSGNRGVGRDSRRSQRLAHAVYANSGPSRETDRRSAGRLFRLLLQLR